MRRRPEDPGWRALADSLPTRPGQEVSESVLSGVFDQDALGEQYILYKRVSREVGEELQPIMTPEDWERWEKSRKRRWAAECHCTRCGHTFDTAWMPGGIRLIQGDDGANYTDEEGTGMEYFDGETALCPACWMNAEVTPLRELRSNRTWQVLQPEVVSVDGYDGVIFWLVSRTVYANGEDALGIDPRDALMIDKAGRVRRFRFVAGVWSPCQTVRDPEQNTYYSWDAANHRAVGGWGFDFWPEQLTGTGEKSAMEEYIACGGVWPGRYLLLWQKHPNVENLMRQGFGWAVTDAVDRPVQSVAYYGDLQDVPEIAWIDWREAKPHRMLHMSKEGFRLARRQRWTAGETTVWRLCRDRKLTESEEEFEGWRREVGAEAVRRLVEAADGDWPDLTPREAIRYLRNIHRADGDGVQMLIDYRRMMRRAGMEETERNLWPRRLQIQHDRAAELAALRQKASDLDGQFREIYEQYKGLEWTDGQLCVVLPRAEWELKAEGKILRHCVGSYGPEHVHGKLILFIRHRRRPERSYYTLNVDVTGQLPREIQLHGYGNERHGAHLQHKHAIPAAVRQFCDRWEREVLTPLMAALRNEQKIKVKGRKSA